MPLLRNIWFELAYIPRSSRGRVGLEEGERVGRGFIEMTAGMKFVELN